LGKLVKGALGTFNSKRHVQLKMVEAWAVLSEGYEIIHGELRCRMNIEIKLECTSDQTPGPSRRLSARLENLETLDTMGAREEGQAIEGLDGCTTEQAMQGFLVPSPSAASKEPPNQSKVAVSDAAHSHERNHGVPVDDNGVLDTLVRLIDDQPQKEVSHRRLNWRQPPASPQDQMQLQPMAAIVGAMCEVLHRLQHERDLSCLAVASATLHQKDDKTPTTGTSLQNQRAETDKAFSVVLEAIQLASKSKVTGNVGSMCRDSSEVFQEVSVKAMLQRPVIDAACETPPEKWMHRYLVCCCGETGYHQLIARVISWTLKVVKHLRQEGGVIAPKFDRHQLMLVVKEHLGHQRSLIAAKGNSRLEENSGKQTWLKIVSGARRVRDLLGATSSSSAGWQEDLSKLLDDLASLQACVMREACEEDFSVPSEQILRCFDRLTLFISEVEEVIGDELDDIMEATPGSSCFPAHAFSSEGYPSWAQVEPSPGGLVSNEVVELVEDWRGGRIKQVVILSGAGISVSANLPDFRSPGGLYDQMRKQGISSPESVFTADFMVECPDIFYKVMRQLRTDDIQPTPTHCFIRLLQDKGLLQRCCTQNIDGLERKVGIQEQKLMEAHGTLGKVRCVKCKRDHPKENLFRPKEADGMPRCEACRGLLRPDIVFFGENLNWNYPTVKAELGAADLVIIMGTSLQVNPFAGIINCIKNSCAILVVNRFMPKALLSARRRRAMTAKLMGKPSPRKEAFMQGDCDVSIQWLAEELGWKDELEELLNARPQMPGDASPSL